MRTARSASVVAVLAVVGLVISGTAAWSRLDSSPTGQGVETDPAAIAVESAPPSRRVDPTGQAEPTYPWQYPWEQVVDRGVRDRPRVGRSDATASARSSRQLRTPRPVRAQLGSAEIDAAVRPVGVEADGQMELPEDPRVLGWYRFGASPGATGGGATVLAGHLDSRRFGLGPLVRLRDVSTGDPISLTLQDGTTQRYVVRTVSRFDRQALPGSLFTRTGPELLHVITCGGAYDPASGGYQQNLVVSAVPVR